MERDGRHDGGVPRRRGVQGGRGVGMGVGWAAAAAHARETRGRRSPGAEDVSADTVRRSERPGSDAEV